MNNLDQAKHRARLDDIESMIKIKELAILKLQDEATKLGLFQDLILYREPLSIVIDQDVFTNFAHSRNWRFLAENIQGWSLRKIITKGQLAITVTKVSEFNEAPIYTVDAANLDSSD